MKKKTLFVVLIDIIMLACYNAIFFINVKEPIPQTWISYGFITFAFLMMVFTPLFLKKSKSKYLFTVVNLSISFVYFITSVVLGLTLIIKQFSVKFLLTFFIILTAVYLILLLLMLIIGTQEGSKPNP